MVWFDGVVLVAELNVAVVGCGYWGPNLIRNFAESKLTRVKYVVDLIPERLAKLSRRYPGTQFVSDFDKVLEDRELDAVVIATPVHTHYQLAKQALLADKHVLVEKPMCLNSLECEELIALAAARKLVLMSTILLFITVPFAESRAPLMQELSVMFFTSILSESIWD